MDIDWIDFALGTGLGLLAGWILFSRRVHRHVEAQLEGAKRNVERELEQAGKDLPRG